MNIDKCISIEVNFYRILNIYKRNTKIIKNKKNLLFLIVMCYQN